MVGMGDRSVPGQPFMLHQDWAKEAAISFPLPSLAYCAESVASGQSNHDVDDDSPAALVIQSGISSCVSVVKPALRGLPLVDKFLNYKKIGHMKSPTLIIHGSADNVVEFGHAIVLAENAYNLFALEEIKGAGIMTSFMFSNRT